MEKEMIGRLKHHIAYEVACLEMTNLLSEVYDETYPFED